MRKHSRRRPAPAPETKIDRSLRAGLESVEPTDRAPKQADPLPSETLGVHIDEGNVSEKLTVALKADGTIDFEKLRTRNRNKLKTAIADPDLAKQLGIVQPATSGPMVFDATLCGILYNALGSLMMLGAARGGYPPDQIKAMAFTPEEVTFLAPPTGRVLDKYLGQSIQKYSDEVALVVALGSVMTGKLSQLKKPGDLITFPQAAPQPVPATDQSIQ